MNKILMSTCLGLSMLCSMNSAYAIDAKYRAKLENSGCTQVSEMQGCDINKTKAENAKAGFSTYTAPSSSNTYAGQWVAKNRESNQTVATIRVDSKENVWVNGQKVKSTRSDGGLVFKQGFIRFTLEGDPNHRNESYWYDVDAQTSGPIRKE